MPDNAKPSRPDVERIELIGGTEVRELEVVSYNHDWPEIFAEHYERLGSALQATTADIHHIGSTSVPGLAAKPIVDIAVAVYDITAEEDYLPPILAAGYILRVREPGHRMVRTPARDVHIHIFERGDPAIARYLIFRDRLRADAADRELYARTKRALIAQGFDDMNAYSDAKTAVIAAIMERAMAATAP